MGNARWTGRGSDCRERGKGALFGGAQETGAGRRAGWGGSAMVEREGRGCAVRLSDTGV